MTLSPASSSAIELQRLAFVDRTLPNGLRVLMLEDRRTPTVAISVGYHVGGKDDPPGRSGFAHLFEHLMFKGTAHMGAETIDRLTEDIGGYNNAYTADDLTNYYEVIPSNYLETLLWAEAERLAALHINDDNFATEREVVIGEYDQRVLADPYGMLDEVTNRDAFAKHPYRRGVIGDPDNLRAASLEDVKQFHATYYRPDNAVIALVGDFDLERAFAWIERYFGPISHPASPVPRVTIDEPPQAAPRRFVYSRANVPLAAFQCAYHVPSAISPDAYALDLLETLLSMGRSSRLYQGLVFKRLATRAYGYADLREQAGLFELRAVANDGESVETLERAVEREIERVQNDPVDPVELEKVKTQVVSALLRGRQTGNDVSLALTRAAIVQGDPETINTDLERYQAVSAADIRRVAQTHLIAANRTSWYYLPPGVDSAAIELK
ncbi:MAG TPA: pitrilysin family protein [Candidatus Acidoferrales bacterium]|nr:pitrilysin family protein [Candidatus Acidoferrales bacterium]